MIEDNLDKIPDGLAAIEVRKSFGETQALNGISFEVAQGEIAALLGPSGCGKSTLLNLIAGLDFPDAGEITWGGRNLVGIPPHKRGFGLMFQDYALFPHKNVMANIAFGLEMASWSTEQIGARVNEMLEIVGLSGYAQRDVGTLSGGEQQRVALARSLAPQPRLLMLDEPLGSLDRALRERLLAELREILCSIQQTAIYVTHDQEEAFSLADRVVVMNRGWAAQIGSPQEIYQQPRSEFVARFLGFNNILEAKVQGNQVNTILGTFDADEIRGWNDEQISADLSSSLSPQISVLVRPDAMRLDGSGTHQINGIAREIAFRGSLYRVVVDVEGTLLTFEVPSAVPFLETGKTVTLGFNPEEAIQILI